MTTNADEELSALGDMTTNELCECYRQLFGQPVRTRHKQYLIGKIAWRIQALAEGTCRSGRGGGRRSWPTTRTFASCPRGPPVRPLPAPAAPRGW